MADGLCCSRKSKASVKGHESFSMRLTGIDPTQCGKQAPGFSIVLRTEYSVWQAEFLFLLNNAFSPFDRHLDAALAVVECDGKCLDLMAILCELHAHNL